jgi:nucleotide-binding universal stress UspA family protein
VEHAHDIPQVVRRAFKVAAEPPQGPVFLSLPMDVLDQEANVDIRPTSYTSWRTRPDAAALAQAAELLLGARNPMIVAGDRVALSGAQGEVIALAELLGAAKSARADVVVVGARGIGGLERLLLGSVAEPVTHEVSLPVLLARAGEGAPVLDRLPGLKHVLIPLDGSSFAEQVIPHAATLAALLRAEVTLVSVVDAMLALASAAGEEGAAPAQLDHAADRLRARGLVVHTSVLADRRPAHAIVNFASQHSIDLIAMTTHGRGALRRLFAGSVAEQVVRTSPTPVLMYRPPLE